MRYYFLYLLSIVFIFSSCHTSIEITKRKYRPGFFLDISSQSKNAVLINTKDRNIETKINVKNAEEINSPKIRTGTVKEFLNKRASIQKETLLAFDDHKFKTSWIKTIRTKKNNFLFFAFPGIAEDNPPVKHTPTSAILAFIFGALSILSLLLLGLPDIYFFTIAPVLIIAAFIAGCIALRKLKNNPELKGQGFATFGFLIGILGLIGIIVATLLVLSSI